MSELRLALAILGVLLVLGVLGLGFWHRRSNQPSSESARRAGRGTHPGSDGREPVLGQWDEEADLRRPLADAKVEIGDLQGLSLTPADRPGGGEPAAVPAASVLRRLLERNTGRGEEGTSEVAASAPNLSPRRPGREQSGREQSVHEQSGQAQPRAVRPGDSDTDVTEALGQGAARAVTESDYGSAPRGGEPLLVVLTLIAPGGQPYRGGQLRRVLEGFDLRHGDMGLFHYHARRAEPGLAPVFSVANAIEPGNFQLDTIEDVETPGLSLFMQLPGPMESVLAFDVMLDVSTKIARELGGELRDEHRGSLSAQATARLREQVIEFGAGLHRSVPDSGRPPSGTTTGENPRPD